MSHTQIRQRINHSQSQSQSSESTNPRISHSMRAAAQPGDALAASTLLQSNPTHAGQAYKLDIPFFYVLLPTMIQRFLRYIPFAGKLGLIPSWKKRYLIQIGNYVYRYQINGKVNNGSNVNNVAPSITKKMKLKGSPIPLQTIQCEKNQNTTIGVKSNSSNDEIISYAREVPSTCHGFFSITSNGQTRYYAVSTPEEASVWIQSLREGRQGAIERSMGHDRRPYPESWKYIDLMGKAKVQKNERIRKRIDRDRMKEVEMMEFMGGSSAGAFSSGMTGGHFG
jgi:hypothetical protein